MVRGATKFDKFKEIGVFAISEDSWVLLTLNLLNQNVMSSYFWNEHKKKDV